MLHRSRCASSLTLSDFFPTETSVFKSPDRRWWRHYFLSQAVKMALKVRSATVKQQTLDYPQFNYIPCLLFLRDEIQNLRVARRKQGVNYLLEDTLIRTCLIRQNTEFTLKITTTPLCLTEIVNMNTFLHNTLHVCKKKMTCFQSFHQ